MEILDNSLFYLGAILAIIAVVWSWYRSHERKQKQIAIDYFIKQTLPTPFEDPILQDSDRHAVTEWHQQIDNEH